jgi:hypothetical protein
MVSKKTLGLILSGVLALSGVSCVGLDIKSKPVEEIKDFTGDGIKDIMINIDSFADINERYLFIGQNNGEFIRSKEVVDKNNVIYFLTDDGVPYFFDGQFYRASPKQK